MLHLLLYARRRLRRHKNAPAACIFAAFRMPIAETRVRRRDCAYLIYFAFPIDSTIAKESQFSRYEFYSQQPFFRFGLSLTTERNKKRYSTEDTRCSRLATDSDENQFKISRQTRFSHSVRSLSSWSLFSSLVPAFSRWFVLLLFISISKELFYSRIVIPEPINSAR